MNKKNPRKCDCGGITIYVGFQQFLPKSRKSLKNLSKERKIKMEERLQKFLANQGVCSRRKAEEYISLRQSKSKWKNSYRVRNKGKSAKR